MLEDGFNPDIHRDITGEGRWTNLVTETGSKLPGAVANLEVVKDQGTVAPPEIDAEGAQNPSDLEEQPISESLDGRSRVKKYLEEIFREFSGQVYRAEKINERALGNVVDLEQGPNDYIYVIPREKAQKMEQLFNRPVNFSMGGPNLQFSEMTNLDADYLKKEGLGFTKKIEFEGETYIIKFLYQNDGSKDKEEDVADAT